MDKQIIKELILKEVKSAFEQPQASKYESSIEQRVNLLLKILTHPIHNEKLSNVGNSILCGLLQFDKENKLDQLPTRCEPLAKLVMSIVNQSKYKEIQEKKANFARVLSTLDLASGETLSADSVEQLRGEPNFAEHIGRLIIYRNKVHNAPEYSPREKAEIFESICVFMVFLVSEYYEKLSAYLRNIPLQQYYQTICDNNKNLASDYLVLSTHIENQGAIPITLETSNTTNLLQDFQKLVIIGEMGSGKTTTLRYLAWKNAKDLLEEPTNSLKCPVYIELKNCDDDNKLCSIISQKLSLSNQTIKNQLRDGKYILLLDGIDEVPKTFLRPIVNDIEELSNSCSIIVSARKGLRTYMIEWSQIELQPFTDIQVRKYAEENDEKINMLQKNRLLWVWAHNPLILQMLLKLEEKKPCSISQLVLAFLCKINDREVGKRPTKLSFDHKCALLAHLAFCMTKENKETYPRQDCESIFKDCCMKKKLCLENCDSISILNEFIEDSILTKDEYTGRISFSYHLYLECFTAYEIEKINVEEVIQKYMEFNWQNAVIMYAGLKEDFEKIVNKISNVNPYIAARSIKMRWDINKQSIIDIVVNHSKLHINKNDEKLLENSILALVELEKNRELKEALNNIKNINKLDISIKNIFKVGTDWQIISLVECLYDILDSKTQKKVFKALISRKLKDIKKEVNQKAKSLCKELEAKQSFAEQAIVARTFDLLKQFSPQTLLNKLVENFEDLDLLIAKTLVNENDLYNDYPIFKDLSEYTINVPNDNIEYIINKIFINRIKRFGYKSRCPCTDVVDSLLEDGQRESVDFANNILEKNSLTNIYI